MSGPDNPPDRYICSPRHALFDASAVLAAVLFMAGILPARSCSPAELTGPGSK